SAKDADIIIYNSTIEGSITSVDDRLSKNQLFSQFRAVKEGNVYCLDPGFFQKTTEMPEFVTQLSGIIDGTGNGGNIFRKL
ncbi:MAG: ABC transporter substrate-binding protein, partial [Lachnospiraceae bacterium]|nr:ABC transporter substrate-binding protein [Lachnospiraceae bacterium]